MVSVMYCRPLIIHTYWFTLSFMLSLRLPLRTLSLTTEGFVIDKTVFLS